MINIKFGLIAAGFFLIFSCRMTVDGNTVELKEHKLYKKSTAKVFTGEVVERFHNGRISSKSRYVDGIRYGKWSIYGHTGEIIQQGRYLNMSEIKSSVVKSVKCSRIDINHWYEGAVEFLDIYFVYADSSISNQKVNEVVNSMKTEFPLVKNISLFIANYEIKQIYPSTWRK